MGPAALLALGAHREYSRSMISSNDSRQAPTLRSLSRLLLWWEKAEIGAAERKAASRHSNESVDIFQLAAEIAEHRELLLSLCGLLERANDGISDARSHGTHSSFSMGRDSTESALADARLLALVRLRAMGH